MAEQTENATDSGSEPFREETARLSVLGILANAAILVILFIASRFVRALWNPVAGDVCYWLLALWIWIYLATLRVDLFQRVRNPDTSFMLNMIVQAAASVAIVTGLRIATAPLLTHVLIWMK